MGEVSNLTGSTIAPLLAPCAELERIGVRGTAHRVQGNDMGIGENFERSDCEVDRPGGGVGCAGGEHPSQSDSGGCLPPSSGEMFLHALRGARFGTWNGQGLFMHRRYRAHTRCEWRWLSQ